MKDQPDSDLVQLTKLFEKVKGECAENLAAEQFAHAKIEAARIEFALVQAVQESALAQIERERRVLNAQLTNTQELMHQQVGHNYSEPVNRCGIGAQAKPFH